jgi:hypothetical protein
MVTSARVGVLLAIIATTVVGPRPRAALAAGSEDRAAAQALFDEGKRLIGDGQAVKACPKLEESLRLDDAIGTRFQLATCYETTGRTASAWNLYIEVAAAARTLKQPEREAFAREKANALAPQLARLTIVVPDSARLPGMKLTRDGSEVGRGQWGVALPVDPGKHEIEVTAPGKKPLRQSIDVYGAAANETLTVPALLDAPVEAKPMGEKAARAAHFSALQWVGVATAGAGVVGLAAGGVFALVAKNKSAQANCPGGACPDRHSLELNQDARAFGDRATIALIVGGGLAAVGATLFFIPVGRDEAVAVVPSVAPASASLQLAGRF